MQWAQPRESEVTVYSMLLRLTLDQEGDGTDLTIAELVSDAISCRSQLTGFPGGTRSSRRQGVAERIGDSLAYDAALVRLCYRMSLEQELTGDAAGPDARRSAARRPA